MVLLVRPLSVLLSLPRKSLPRVQHGLVAWLGIRGVGTVFYLALALESGVSGTAAQLLLSASLAGVTITMGQ